MFFFVVSIYSRPNYLRVRNAHPEENRLWVFQKCMLESDIPALTTRNLYSSQMSAGKKRSAGQKGDDRHDASQKNRAASGKASFAFSGSLEKVEENSQEDMSSSAFDLSRKNHMSTRQEMPVSTQHDMCMAVPSDSLSSQKDSSEGLKTRACGNYTTESLQSSKTSRVNMDGSVT